jgi:hypothetical protein
VAGLHSPSIDKTIYLATDKEDSKKIKKAEKAALSIIKEIDEKRRSERKKQFNTRYSPYSATNVSVLPTIKQSRSGFVQSLIFVPTPTIFKDVKD